MMQTVAFVVAAFVTAFALACGLGANDVSNAFATTVASGVLSLRNACVIASFAEVLGATLMGGRVTSTIAKSILDTQ